MNKHLEIFEPRDILNLKDVSNWASNYVSKKVSTSNIHYLINYGRIHKYAENICFQTDLPCLVFPVLN